MRSPHIFCASLLLAATTLGVGDALAQSQSMPGEPPDERMAAPLKAGQGMPIAEAPDVEAGSAPKAAPDALQGLTYEAKKKKKKAVKVDIKRANTEDDPKQVTPTTSYPYTAIGMLANGCTGALIGKRFVLTAGFCVYNTAEKSWYQDLHFWPGIDGNTQPYGGVAWKKSYAPKQFIEGNDWNYNFALVELQSDIGDQTGWMGFGYDPDFPFKTLTLTGYPAGVPEFTAWEVTCKLVDKPQNYTIHGCPGKGSPEGVGGAPLWTLDNDNNPMVRAVHLSPYRIENLGHRITKETYDTIIAWMEGRAVSAAE